MAGVYREQLIDNIPPGTSWTNPVTIKNYLGQSVVIANAGNTVLSFRGTLPLQQYIIIEGITIDATGQPNNPSYVAVSLGDGVHHIRFLDCTIKNGGYSCINIGGVTDAEYIEVQRCNIFGSGNGNGIYLATSNCLIEDSEIHTTRAGLGGLGIWISTADVARDPVNNIIRRNRIHGNSNGGIALSASFTQIHNNVIYGNNVGYTGIVLGYRSSKNQNNKIFDNIFYGNGDTILVGAYATAFKTEIKNNIIINSARAGIRLGSSESGGSSSETIIENNLFYNNAGGNIVNERAAGTVESGNVIWDLLFATPREGDLCLLQRSGGAPARHCYHSPRMVAPTSSTYRTSYCLFRVFPARPLPAIQVEKQGGTYLEKIRDKKRDALNPGT